MQQLLVSMKEILCTVTRTVRSKFTQQRVRIRSVGPNACRSAIKMSSLRDFAAAAAVAAAAATTTAATTSAKTPVVATTAASHP